MEMFRRLKEFVCKHAGYFVKSFSFKYIISDVTAHTLFGVKRVHPGDMLPDEAVILMFATKILLAATFRPTGLKNSKQAISITGTMSAVAPF